MAAARKADAEILAIRQVLGVFDKLTSATTKQNVLKYVTGKIEAEIEEQKNAPAQPAVLTSNPPQVPAQSSLALATPVSA